MENDTVPKILRLEEGIFTSGKKNYNNIKPLIELLQSRESSTEDRITGAVSLCRVFTRLMSTGDMEKKKEASEKKAVVVKWLKERYQDYKNVLLSMLSQEEFAATVLTLFMRLLKSEGEYLRKGQEYRFPALFLKDIIHTMLKPSTDASVRKEFGQKHMEEHDDVRFYTLEAIPDVLEEAQCQYPMELVFENVMQIMTAIESVPESKDELEDFWVLAPEKKTHALYSLTHHKNRAQEAWLSILNIEMGKQQRKKVLEHLTTSIVPWFLKPELLMDFLTDSYNTGSSVSLLALSGVFYLIQEKNLDYPSFYRKLYSLLDNNLLHSKHRSRFFRLLDTFLASTHLPAVLVASFIKRLSRLCLNAPPAGIVAVIPWVYNLLKKHPTCTFMIHRETREAEAKELLENEGLDDPFDMEVEDPMETDAISSSLWELVTLQSHYHPNVATLAKIISEQFTKHAYNLEDFSDHSYGSMLDAELSKAVKVPVVEYNIPKKIFTKHEEGAGDDRLLVKLWSFT